MFDIITIGTATQDVCLIGKSFRVFNDARFSEKLGFVEHGGICFALGGKIEVDDVIITTGGGATNAAVTFSRQGFRTACIAKIGDDFPGKMIEVELRRERVIFFPSRDKSKRTAYSTLLLTSDGERTILVYRGASEILKSKDIPWSKLNVKWAYIASGGIEFPLLKKIVNHFYSRGAFVALNPGKAQLALGLRRLVPVISKTKVFIVNREEASRLAGVPYDKEQEIFAKLDRAVSGILVITDAERGSKVSDGKTVWRAGVFRERRLADRTGAGDAFGSGFVAGLMQKGEKCEKGICKPQNIAYALRLASANATSNIESIGATSGILTKKGFQAKRWSRLRISVVK